MFTIGQKVVFGRVQGEKTLGTVVAVNGKSVKVRQDEARGSKPVGTVWGVAPSLVRPLDGAAAAPAPTVTAAPAPAVTAAPAPGWKVGDRASFTAQAGRVVTGTVTRVNTKTVTIEGCDDGSRGYRVPPSMLRAAGASGAGPAPAAPRRADDAIMGDIFRAYGDLSPENLSCDGELSRSQVATRRAAVNRRLAALQAEMGRRVSEDEAWRWWSANRRPA